MVTIEAGPEVLVPRARIQALAFVLHELAANAVKHGALSTPEGKLRLSWTTAQSNSGSYLYLSWQELGGPPVVPPASQGFGLKLMGMTVGELGGRPELTFEPEGLAARVSVRLD